MEPGGGLVQNVDGATSVSFAQLGCEFHPLGLTTGQRGRALSKVDVPKSHIIQDFQFCSDTRLRLKKLQRIGHRQIQHIRNGFPFVPNIECFSIVPSPLYRRRTTRTHPARNASRF